jgi:hypothetical protein
MTDQELIDMARKRAEAYSAQPKAPVQLSRLPNIRLRQAVVVSFEGDPSDGRIEVILDRESGELVQAGLIPAKARDSKVHTFCCGGAAC